MLESWTYCASHDVQAMTARVASMRDVLERLDTGPAGTQPLSSAELLDYCRSLVKGQRKGLGRTKPGSWSVAPDDEGMPSDARVQFIFDPTYLAVAILTRTLLDRPWIAIQVPGYAKALKKGLHFCTYRSLQGSGYQAIEGMLDAFVILAIGKVPVLLERSPEFSPKLHQTIVKLESFLKEALLNNETHGPWGADLSSGYQAALETLYLYRDTDLRDSVRQAREAGSSDLSGGLPW